MSRKFYRLRWHKPIFAPGGSVAERVMVGSIEDPSAAWLRSWVLDQAWPDGTVFEVSRTDGERLVEVRCLVGHLQAWKPSRQRLPLHSDLPLPEPRSVKLLIFANLIGQAFEYAVEARLTSETIAAGLQSAILDRLES